MKLLITGGSGLIGSALIDGLKNQHQMTVLGRTLTTLQARFKELPCLTWKSLTADRVAQYDVIINLAGENIGRRRWSSRQKQRIIASRVNTTTRLATYCAQLGHQSPRLFNASAIGIYGLPLMQDEMFDESSILPEQSTDFFKSGWSAMGAKLTAGDRCQRLCCCTAIWSRTHQKRGGISKTIP